MTLQRVFRISLLSLGLVALLLTLLGLFLARGKSPGPRHEPHGEAPFDYAGGSFRDYIDYSVQRLRDGRLQPTSEAQLANLAPFILEPPAQCERLPDGRHRRGILLTHGLIASPYSMRPIGEFFQSQCFLVFGHLLPDHGTRPGDMLDSDWHTWAEAHRFATDRLSQRVDELWLSGHSAGGTLALYEAATREDVDGLVLFAPALRVAGVARYAGLLSLLGSVFPGAAWFEVEPDEATYRYESFPLRSGYETWALIRATHEALAGQALELPIFMVASLEDTTVDVQAELDFMARYEGPGRTLLYSREPVGFEDERIVVVESARDGENILSVSHLGLMTPPEHPFYGVNGSYRYCGHYLPDAPDSFAACRNGESRFQGEITPENLQRGLLQRITYNPFYDRLLEELSRFLEQHSGR